MARKSGNTDRLLINFGKKIAYEVGFSALRIRELADRAGVNLGMFHYHFKNKKRFTRILLQELYEDFISELTTASHSGRDGVSQLRSTLMTMARYVRDHQEFYLFMLKDILNDDAEVLRFVRKNFPRHLAVIQGLIERCQKEGTVARLPFPQVLAFMMAGMNIPTLVAGAMERRAPKSVANLLTSDRALEQRLDLVLRGLRP